MKKTIILLNLVLWTSFVFGNNTIKEHFGSGKFFVEGEITGMPKSFDTGILQILVEGYIEQKLVDIPINKKGIFEAEIPITDIQDISFFIKETQIKFFTFKDDTIRIKFQYDNPLETIKLSGISEQRTNELELCTSLSKYKAANPQSDLKNMMQNNSMPDSVKIKRLNQYYKEQVKIINGFLIEKSNTTFLNKLINDVYFQTCQIALLGGKKFQWSINNGFSDTMIFYNTFDYDIFRSSPIYRYYLSYFIFLNRISTYDYNLSDEDVENEISDLKKEYYYALSQIAVPHIRDWYITERFLLYFSESSLDDINFVLSDFKTICQNKYYIDKLEEFHSNMQQLYNAPIAPNFELKHEKGETVSLADFNNSIVYLDFWDTHCAPCINEFKNYDKKFHEKYKQHKIVHIYICFSNDEDKWRKDIAKYDLKGVNLITQSGKDNALYKDYAFSAFPHYVLIGRSGKIYKNGCERPSKMLDLTENSLDKLLKIDN